jgi:uncharacterized protein
VIDDSPYHEPPRSVVRVGAVPRLAAAVVTVVVLAVACGADDTADGPAPDAAGVEDTTTTVVDVATGSAPSGDCPEPDGDLARFGSAIVVTSADGVDVESCLLLADDLGLRQRGLMEVTDLGPFDGMLFAYPGESSGGYWMRDTPMPLSIAWVSSEGVVVGTADMEPCLDAEPDCPSTDPGASYQWAIEVPQGGLGALGLDDRVELDVSDWPLGTG